MKFKYLAYKITYSTYCDSLFNVKYSYHPVPIGDIMDFCDGIA